MSKSEEPNNDGLNRQKPKLIAFGVALALIGYFASAFFFDVRRQSINVTGTVQAKEVPVASKIGGRIARVCVQEGQEVKAGAPIVEFEVPEMEAKRKQLEAEVAASQSKFEQLKNGPRAGEIEKARAQASEAMEHYRLLKTGNRLEDIDKARSQRLEAESNFKLLEQGYRGEDIKQAKAQLDQAQTQLDFAQKDCQRYEFLATKGAVSKRQADDAHSRRDAAVESKNAAQQNYNKQLAGPRQEEIQAAKQRLEYAKKQEQMMLSGARREEIRMAYDQYESANATLKLLIEGTRKEEIASAQASLDSAKARLAELDAQLKDKVVYAPVEAEVSVMDLHEGEIIPANRSVATLTRLDDVWTRVYVPERELARVTMGQAVKVRVDAFPNKEFRGHVVQIPSVAEFTPRNVQTAEERSAQVFGLKVAIENKERLLRGGMNAEIELPPLEGPFASLAKVDNAARDRH